MHCECNSENYIPDMYTLNLQGTSPPCAHNVVPNIKLKVSSHLCRAGMRLTSFSEAQEVNNHFQP